MSTSSWLWVIAGGVLYAVTWFAASEAAEWLAAPSPARAAYGGLCAWWSTLFLSYVLNLDWKAAVPAAILHVPLSLISPHPKSMLTEMSLADLARFDVLLLLAVAILLFLSPLFISTFVRLIKTKLLQRLQAEA